MNDFHLKFSQCFNCNGFGSYNDKIYDEFNRGFCCKECYEHYGTYHEVYIKMDVRKDSDFW